MAKISYVRKIKDTPLLRLGIVEEGEKLAYTVSERLYSELSGLAVGEEIDEYTLDKIRGEDEYYNAKKKALSLLAYADNNEKTLVRKLLTKGISRSVAEDVAREMVSLGYINEERQLERIILNEANRNFSGPEKIFRKLAAKGYSISKIKEVIRDLLDNGEIDFSKNASALIERKIGPDSSAEEKKKLLFRYGYKPE